jgi:hypothetical protein
MLQLVFDIRKLAKENNFDPDEVMKKQKTLIILNEETGEQISQEFMRHKYLGLSPENVFFMIQKSFHGISIDNGRLYYDEKDENDKELNNKRLHNHGQMIMQKMHDKVIYRLIDGRKEPISTNDFLDVLGTCEDMISYNIEDIGYLTNAIDLHSMQTALELGDKGYEMVMEVVGQNPKKPQKGASLFLDPSINKNVMIESFRLSNLKNEDLKLMNKNFNHYPHPSKSMKILREKGLPLGFEVKKANDGKEYMYLCTVQGDLNFLVKTAYVTRKVLKPIRNWKSAATTTQTIKAMHDQDNQKGFKELAKEYNLI